MKEDSELKLFLAPARQPTAGGETKYMAAFNVWHKVWRETLHELDGAEQTFSDGFTRQDFFAAIFDGEICAALVMFRKIDLRHEVHWLDSWFSSWKSSDLREISKTCPVCMVPSWLTVHPLYRKTTRKDGTKISALVSEVMAQMCLEMEANVGVGVSRNNRGVNKLVYHAGAVPIVKGHVAHGVDVDLVAFYPENILKAKENYSDLFFKLWENRVTLGKIEEVKGRANETNIRKAS